MQNITILGSTGSIGLSTLDVVSHHPDLYRVFALTANRQVKLLVQQCQQFQPRYVVLPDDAAVKEFHSCTENLNLSCEVLLGEAGLCEVAAHADVDIVMAAIVGAAGLSSTLAALAAGKKVLLANKEALVMAGDLVLKTITESGAQLIPVDSEHNALFQCLPAEFMAGRLFPRHCEEATAAVIARSVATKQSRFLNSTPGLLHSARNDAGITKLVLTASGGATRDLPLDKLTEVTPEFACTHPNWSMGKKVTVDSATMMNKALEVIEAYYLFGLPLSQIETILHPQSIIHSFVYYDDGSVLAQLGEPDMRTPIACALAWPERISTKVKTLDLTQIPALTFTPLDLQRYPCVELAYQALRAEGLATTVLNASNEIAVERFLRGEIRFTDIYALNDTMLSKISYDAMQDLDAIKSLDLETRERARAW